MSDGSAWSDSQTNRKRRSWLERIHVDGPLLILVVLLLSYGLAVFYSATGSHERSPDASAVAETVAQAKTIGISLLVMLMVAQFPSVFLKMLAPVGYVLSVVLLILVEFYGISGGNAQRWLDLGNLLGVGTYVLQPSELLKITVPLMIAATLAVAGSLPRVFTHIVGVTWIVIPFVMLISQPDVGTAGVVALAGGVALFLGKMPRVILMGALFAASTVALDTFVALEPMKQHIDDHPEMRRSKALAEARKLGWETSVIGKQFFKPYHYERIYTMLYPDQSDKDKGYQSNQALIAIGSGGMFGYGWLKGPQSHNSWVPERDTDFIFVVLAEDFGLAGALVYLVLCLLITIRGLMISAAASNAFDRVLAGTLSLMFFVYVFVNIAMVTGLLPVVGIPLPLVSRGGTFLLVVMVSFGVLMSIHTHKGEQRR